MIILFGSYARGDWVQDLSSREYYQSDIDLLLVLKKICWISSY
ncbi:nucleotidyltransferase domain-containing protein [Candidatus Tisiphia endosymbiont of Dioctria rufipes]